MLYLFSCLLIPDSTDALIVGKESACNARDPGSIPGSGRSAEEGIGYPLQDSWVSLVAQLVNNPPAIRETWVSNSWVSWGGKIPWRRERLPTPVFWPRKFHGLYSPWSHKELDTTGPLLLSPCGCTYFSCVFKQNIHFCFLVDVSAFYIKDSYPCCICCCWVNI